jgi:hypothetical protein
MDPSIAGFAAPAPRRFLRDWLLTVLVPGAACGALAVLALGRNVDLDHWVFIFILGTPVLFWFLVGVLQGRLLRRLIDRPKVWAVATWAGGSLALAGGAAAFAWLAMLLEEFGFFAFEPDDAATLVLFGASGMAAGGIAGFVQAVALRATWRERGYWLGASIGGGVLAFALLWVGTIALAQIQRNGTLSFPEMPFFALLAAFLLAGALAHGLFTGIAMQRLLARRARHEQEALVGQFD